MPAEAESIIDDPDLDPQHGGLPPDTRKIGVDLFHAERKKAATAKRELASITAERDRIAAELAAAKAEAESHKPLADRWREHSAAEERRLKDATAAKLAALPDALRAKVAALPLDAQALWFEAREEAAPTPAAVPEQHPVGGRTAGGTPSPDELKPAEKEWARKAGKLDIGLTNETIRVMFKAFGPKQ